MEIMQEHSSLVEKQLERKEGNELELRELKKENKEINKKIRLRDEEKAREEKSIRFLKEGAQASEEDFLLSDEAQDEEQKQDRV
eukprot:CAMPEP_0170554784 /NCGR_PEP_ID=MMETSP0211-20121228/12664_1 /TAXON_ID=311385 /ORGANISM="Pseudokeronopsis sp., Strain OXSARD2" /LENGTH=83 /DNA_ID=CAMNT_0010864131 /DNA_START=144 /DNA_END=395 /DNA_ORIENTATION=+